jgi:hypothetical protein
MLPTFHVFTGFLSADECKALVDDFEDGRRSGICIEDGLKRLSFDIGRDRPAHWIRKRLKASVEDVFRRPLVDDGCHLTAYPPGVRGQEMHRDDGRMAPGVDLPYEVRLFGGRIAGAILYLNDEFDGGDLRYFQGPQFKPVPGLLIVHNGEAVHGVTPITGGTRYTIGAFYIA